MALTKARALRALIESPTTPGSVPQVGDLLTFTVPRFGTPNALEIQGGGTVTDTTQTSHELGSCGISDGSTHRAIGWAAENALAPTDTWQIGRADAVFSIVDETGTEDCRLSFSRWVEDGVELEVEVAPSSTWRVQLTLWRAPQAKVLEVSTPSVAYTATHVESLGFEFEMAFSLAGPDAFDGVIRSHGRTSMGMATVDAGAVNQGALSRFSADNVTGSDVQAQVHPDRFCSKFGPGSPFYPACVLSFPDADGFHAYTWDAGGGVTFAGLFFDFDGEINRAVTIYDTPTTGDTPDTPPDDFDQTAPGFLPQLITKVAGTANSLMWIGGANASGLSRSTVDQAGTQTAIAWRDQESANPSKTQTFADDRSHYVRASTGPLILEAEWLEMLPTGWSERWHKRQALSRKYLVAMVGGQVLDSLPPQLGLTPSVVPVSKPQTVRAPAVELGLTPAVVPVLKPQTVRAPAVELGLTPAVVPVVAPSGGGVIIAPPAIEFGLTPAVVQARIGRLGLLARCTTLRLSVSGPAFAVGMQRTAGYVTVNSRADLAQHVTRSSTLETISP